MFIKRILITLLFAAIGIALFLFGRYVLNNPTIPAEYAGETKAVITQIEKFTKTGSDGKKTETHDVTVTFTVDGKEYGGLLNEYNSSMKKGGEIELIYDTRDPSTYETPGKNKMMAYILMGMGVVFFLCGFAALSGKVRITSRNRGLLHKL